MISLGFPYANEEEIKKDLDKLLEPLFTNDTFLKEDDQLILMTHVGPRHSCKRKREEERESGGKISNVIIK